MTKKQIKILLLFLVSIIIFSFIFSIDFDSLKISQNIVLSQNNTSINSNISNSNTSSNNQIFQQRLFLTIISAILSFIFGFLLSYFNRKASSGEVISYQLSIEKSYIDFNESVKEKIKIYYNDKEEIKNLFNLQINLKNIGNSTIELQNIRFKFPLHTKIIDFFYIEKPITEIGIRPEFFTDKGNFSINEVDKINNKIPFFIKDNEINFYINYFARNTEIKARLVISSEVNSLELKDIEQGDKNHNQKTVDVISTSTIQEISDLNKIRTFLVIMLIYFLINPIIPLFSLFFNNHELVEFLIRSIIFIIILISFIPVSKVIVELLYNNNLFKGFKENIKKNQQYNFDIETGIVNIVETGTFDVSEQNINSPGDVSNTVETGAFDVGEQNINSQRKVLNIVETGTLGLSEQNINSLGDVSNTVENGNLVINEQRSIDASSSIETDTE